MKGIAILAVALSVAIATNGIDLSQCFNNFSCLKSSGEDFVITRSWLSYGAFDSCGAQNVRNAKNAGIQYVDVYMFPCRGQSASSQVSSLVSGLSSSLGEDQFDDERELLESSYGMIWIDVETNPSRGCGWGSDYSANCQYVEELISAIQSHGRKAGVYSSEYMWEQIMGSRTACTGPSKVDLWYAHYDHSASFSDYRQIGGWSSPSIKQYVGDTSECGVGVDRNFY